MGDWDYINEHMGGWNDDTGLPNFMDEPGFSNDSYNDKQNDYNNEDDSNNLDVEFNIGDTVSLNSSDVLMTIQSINNDILSCRWFDKNDILQNSTFNISEINIKEKQQQVYLTTNQSVSTIDVDEDEIPF